MATRWRWRCFNLENMKFSQVFNGFWWFLNNFSMNFGILSAHFGTETQCSVDPSGAKSAYLETSQNLTKHSKTLIKTHETSRKSKFLNSFAKKRKYPFKIWKKESQQHPVFPGGHPSKYWLGSMLLNFSDRTRTGVFNMIWPLARIQENFNILFQQHTCMYNTSQFLQCKKSCHTVTKTCKKKVFLQFLAFSCVFLHLKSKQSPNHARNCKKIQESARKCKKVLENAKKCKKMQENVTVGRHRDDTGTDTGTTVGRLWEDFVTTVWLWIYPEFTPNLPPKVVLNEEKVLKKS